MPEAENAEDAVSTSRKRLNQLRATFPLRLRVLEKQVGKKLREAPNKQEQLRVLYKTIDELMSAVMPKTPCRRGCSSCCHIPVEISLDEADFIEERTGARQHPPTPPQNFLGTPCPFLKNAECTIYENRPFACRRHVVLFKTAYWCDVERCNTLTVPQIRFTELEEEFRQMRSSSSVIDIRQVFDASHGRRLRM